MASCPSKGSVLEELLSHSSPLCRRPEPSYESPGTLAAYMREYLPFCGSLGTLAAHMQEYLQVAPDAGTVKSVLGTSGCVACPSWVT